PAAPALDTGLDHAHADVAVDRVGQLVVAEVQDAVGGLGTLALLVDRIGRVLDRPPLRTGHAIVVFPAGARGTAGNGGQGVADAGDVHDAILGGPERGRDVGAAAEEVVQRVQRRLARAVRVEPGHRRTGQVRVVDPVPGVADRLPVVGRV